MSNQELHAIINRLNPLCRQTLEQAAALCLSRSHFYVEIEHWLLKLLETGNSDFNVIVREFQVNQDQLTADLNRRLEKRKTGNDQPPALSPNLVTLAREGWLMASLEFGETETRSANLIQALLESDHLHMVADAMSEEFAAIKPAILRGGYPDLLEASTESGSPLAASEAGSAPVNRVSTQSTGALDQFTQDLTAQAREGKIDPVIGREHEIRQVIDILTRRRQNNPILTGEPGVGKTAVAEGFALKIAEGDVPPSLANVSLRVLDLGLLQAGAGVKGEFENRLKNLISDVKQSEQPVILFIDEAHTLIGAGGAAGQADAANLLKPALARGELRTIAATTWAEYKQYFEKDAALTRRFQVVKVEEPDEATAIRMLRGVAETLGEHHQVRILDAAVQAAVNLSHRYIPGRKLPDKAISLLDTACARVGISQATKPGALVVTQTELDHLAKEIAVLEREQQQGTDHSTVLAQLQEKRRATEEALAEHERLWQEEQALMQAIGDLRLAIEQEDGDIAQAQDDLAAKREALAQLQGERPLIHELVDPNVVAGVIADWTGIPVGRMRSDEIERILNLKATMGERVIGQDHAIEAIAKNIHAARAKLTDPRRPIGIFLLAGPSGVGKTETALTLAEQLYGSERNIITINMTEYKEEHKVSLLLGSPPGYVGYGEGGVLTEAVRRQPYSVVLLDEMEKAHPGVHDVFYQIFDKGMVKDGEGREIDFKNTVIIMTSNAGTDLIAQRFAEADTPPPIDELKQALYDNLLDTFKPAFLGRAEIVPYQPLSPEILAGIARLKLQDLGRQLAEHYQAELRFEDALLDAITAQCDEAGSGARNIQRILSQQILPQLSVQCLESLARKEAIQAVNLGFVPGEGFQVQLVS